jgi:hypothetical protein
MIYSTTYVTSAASAPGSTSRSSTRWSARLVALLVCLSIDYRMLAEHSLVIYGASCCCCLRAVLRRRARAARALDLDLGPVQPAALGVRRSPRARAREVLRREPRAARATRRATCLGGVFLAVPLLLIAKQPDLGTAVTLRAGLPRRSPTSPGCACGSGRRSRWSACSRRPVAWQFALRTTRSRAHRDVPRPRAGPRGAGYQQIQARITVGSGGLTGKGFMQGTQGQYKFLPVAHNDFIFSVLAEEQGFLRASRRARALPVRHPAIARGGPAGQGPARRLPGLGSCSRVHVPGRLQHHHVGRPRAGQGADAAAHELRRLVDDRHAGGVRPHPQREDAAVHELTDCAASRSCTGSSRHRPEAGWSAGWNAPRWHFDACGAGIPCEFFVPRLHRVCPAFWPGARRPAPRRQRAPGRGGAAMNKEMIISSNGHETRWPSSRTTRSPRSSSSASAARRRRQRLQGPGLEGAARHAVGLR